MLSAMLAFSNVYHILRENGQLLFASAALLAALARAH